MVNYDKDVYYSKIQYDEKLNKTKEAYIKDKYDDVSKEAFKSKIDSLWLNIDHSYMERTINELQAEIRKDNGVTLQQQQRLPDRYELNDLDTFTTIEKKYDTHIVRSFNASTENSTDYLTEKIKDFYKLERIIPYYPHGDKSEDPISWHTPSEYLSMLYNVNLRMASWNQTIKDGEVLGIDTVKLMSHPNACPVCNEHAERLYSISGKGPHPSIEQTYQDGVGHPNCKCNFILWWRRYGHCRCQNRQL